MAPWPAQTDPRCLGAWSVVQATRFCLQWVGCSLLSLLGDQAPKKARLGSGHLVSLRPPRLSLSYFLKPQHLLSPRRASCS